MPRRLAIGATVLALAVVPTAGAASLIGITSPVHPGGYVTLSIRANGTHILCSLRVRNKLHPATVVPGLGPKGGLFGGILQWRWRMPAHAARGVWLVNVSCGAGGSVHTSLVVR